MRHGYHPSRGGPAAPDHVPPDLLQPGEDQPGEQAPPERKRIPRARLVAAGVLVAAAGTSVGILLSSGGPALAASPAQISKYLVGSTSGSPLPIFVVKQAQVIGTPADNGKTETARVTITWGLIPGASGTVPPPQQVAFTLNDKTHAWSTTYLTHPSYSGTVYLKPGMKIQAGSTEVTIGAGGATIPVGSG